VGRLSTLAGWARLLFSLASAAAVTWAIMKPLFRPALAVRKGGRRDTLLSISIAMRRSAMAPTSAMAQRHRVGRQRHRLGVEVAAGDHRPIVGKDQRVVGHRIGLAHQHQRGMAQLVQAGAHHLRLAAQAVRVLHAVVASVVRLADGAAGQQAAVVLRHVDLAGLAAQAWMRGSNGPSLPRAASTVSAPITSAASSTGSKLNSACSASAVLVCVPLISARPSLAASTSGRDAGLAASTGPAPARAGRRQHLALAQQRQRHVRQRCQVAGRADRALAGHVGHQAGIVHRQQRVDHHRPHA
jgi:hypothetical protein